MIRIVTLDPIDPSDMAFLTATLYRAFGLGTEHAGERPMPREAIHAVGHLWDLHHCYDPKCAMHPSWSPGLPANPEMDLDTFCREKSERRIRLAKT